MTRTSRVFLQCSDRVWDAACRFEDTKNLNGLIERIVDLSTRTRYEGLLALLDLVDDLDIPLPRKAIELMTSAIEDPYLEYYLRTYLEAISGMPSIGDQVVAESLLVSIGVVEINKGTNSSLVRGVLRAATGRADQSRDPGTTGS